MSDRTLSRDALGWAIANADLDEVDLDRVIREDYEGRGGRAGVGLIVDDQAVVAQLAVLMTIWFHDQAEGDDDAFRDGADALADMMRVARSDGMGRDKIVVYFPGYTLA